MITPTIKTLETELFWSKEGLTKKSKMKNEGAGSLLLGIGTLAAGVCNHLLLQIMYESRIIWSAVTACCVPSDIALAWFGIKLINKVGASVVEETAKDSGYTAKEILECYQENRQPSTLLLSLSSSPSKERDSTEVGFLTKSWLKLPKNIFCGTMRISDAAAIWYEEAALPGYDPGIFVMKGDGKLRYVRCKSGAGREIVDAIIARNSKDITIRKLMFGENGYGVFQSPQKTADIHRITQYER